MSPRILEDIARCNGQYNAETKICPKRDACLRYKAFAECEKNYRVSCWFHDAQYCVERDFDMFLSAAGEDDSNA